MSTGAVIVRNEGKEDFEARFDGQDYVFQAGKDTPCALEAAYHIFGYGLKGKPEDVKAALISIGHRHGFHVTKDGNSNAQADAILRRFKDFKITAARLVADEPTPGGRGRRQLQEETAEDE